ncbi:MAG TPA: hypothetical protein VD866_20495 [Urbifossiella sp.]|nr:hypothetical protein [Urbifossiella sp.]
MLTRSFLFLAAVVLLAPGGCGPAKLEETRTWTVSASDSGMSGEVKTMMLPKQPKPQRITVEYESNQPVDVGIYKSEDVKEGDINLPTSKALALDRAKSAGSIQADLGPDVATTVTVTGLSKTATVKLTVHNKK